MKLLYQKIYFKSNEWKEFISFLKTINKDITVSLLSKNIFFNSFKIIKNQFLGECFIINISITNKLNFFSLYLDLINKIQSKYNNRLFFIGFLYEQFNKIYFLTKNQIQYYSFFFENRKNNNFLFNINLLFLYEFFKFFKLLSVNREICLSFFKKNKNIHFFNLYY